MSYIYLASPYTHEDPAIMEVRYEAVLFKTAELLRSFVAVYSPIVHCHELAKYHELPRDYKFWEWYNSCMLEACSQLQVLCLPKWNRSDGVQSEIQEALRLGKPVSYIEGLTDIKEHFSASQLRQLAG